MNYKKIVPCIYLKNKKAMFGLGDENILSENPIALAREYSNCGADELLIFDLSTTDAEHEESLGLIKEIGSEIDIPMIGAGNVKRMEDVKKIIYAGCQKAALNFSKQENVDLVEEVSKKFGKEKIVACISNIDQLTENESIIKNYISELILMEENKLEDCIEWITSACKENQNPCSMEILPIINKGEFHDAAALLRKFEILGVSGSVLTGKEKDYMDFKQQCKHLDIAMNTFESSMKWSEFKLGADGLIPVIVQDYKTGEVLMMAYMNEEAFSSTIDSGVMTYWSRSRKELWKKGETSGHFQYVRSLTADCDSDTILAKVLQIGVACHTGSRSCFFRELVKKEYDETNPLKVFEDVYRVILDRKENPKEGSYTNYLFEKGIDKILKKLGEEATEIIIAAKNPDPEEIKYEISDFLYHAMVLMAEKGVTWEDIVKELAHR